MAAARALRVVVPVTGTLRADRVLAWIDGACCLRCDYCIVGGGDA
jgi:hypothetical protein